MSVWGYLSIGLCSIIIIRSIQNLYNLYRSFEWLNRPCKASYRGKTRFLVCIPALNEQDTIIETIEKLLNQSYSDDLISIYIATSAKEKSLPNESTTKEVIDRYIALLDNTTRNRVHVLHYPKLDGYTAHQVNFVADSLRGELKKNDTYFVIYNADSHIDKNMFKIVDSIITNRTKLYNKKPTILQQSAVYQYAGKSIVAEGAGLHQTLWTLTHEIPKLKKQSSRIQNLRGLSLIESVKNSRVVHCVGHGLFVRGDYCISHPLPQDILNEDLPYGLRACALREPIYPIPSLELASTPNKIFNVYLQKATWFNPFFEFANYGKKLIQQKSYTSKFEVLWLLIQAYTLLCVWLLHSIILVGGFVVSIVAGWVYVGIWIVSFFLYWVVPASFVTSRRISLVNGGSNSYKAILGGVPYVLTHSVGPLISVCHWLITGIYGTKPSKRKTKSA